MYSRMTFSVVSSYIFSLLVWTLCVCTSDEEIVVVLKAEVLQERLELTCYVSKLQHGVEFTDPSGKTRADCAAPIPSTPPHCHPENITTQDLDKKRTKLILSPITDQDIGKWGCKHGTNRGFDFVTVSLSIVSPEHKDPFGMTSTDHQTDETEVVTTEVVTNPTGTPEESNKSDGSGTITVVFVVFVIVVIGVGMAFFLSWCFKKRRRTSQRNGELQETHPLMPSDDKMDKTIQNCYTCKKHTRFCYCYECSKSFCEICQKSHFRNKNHHIIQTHHSPENYANVTLKCKKCEKRNVSKICFKCTEAHATCLECECDHQKYPSDVFPVIKESIGVIAQQKGGSKHESGVKPVSNIDLTEQKPRVRGLGLLDKNTVLVTDFWNKKLLSSNGNLELALDSEPRGLVRLDKPNTFMTFAVTFGYEHKIKIYEIHEEHFSLSEIKQITVDGHPFQIAHHKGFFAVEMNEGHDGKIVIMNAADGSVKYTILNNDYMIGFFTGNSLRLALNVDKQDLYVSAIGKQTFFCLNFEGHIKWQIQIPSPRSVVELPGDRYKTNILLASRLSNKIFHVRCKMDHNLERYHSSVEALNFDDLTKPDFIEYHTLEGKDAYLTVEVERYKVNVYEMPNLKEDYVELSFH